MTNVVSRWAARRKVGRVALAAILANELEFGDLGERLAACLDENGADQTTRDAVARELAVLRRTATSGLRHAQVIEEAGAGETSGAFFHNVEQAGTVGRRLLPDAPAAPGSR